jgi:hypothetical protein
MLIKRKSKEWLQRYLPSEIAGTVSAIASASLARHFSSNMITIAYVGSLGESIGFFTTVFIQQLLVVTRKNKAQLKSFSVLDFTKIIGSMALEYGPAGIIDSFLLRPFFMYVFPSVLHNFTLGILVGKLVGDFTFYLMVILSYELKKKKISRG